jgi:hypothetical protein
LAYHHHSCNLSDLSGLWIFWLQAGIRINQKRTGWRLF